MILKRHSNFLNESNFQNLKTKIWNILASTLTNGRGAWAAPTIQAFDTFSKFDVYTNDEWYTIELNPQNDVDNMIVIKDRYNKKVDENELETLHINLQKYMKFLNLNKDVALSENIAAALSGNLEHEKTLFDAVTIHKHLKWSDFSEELINVLTDEQKILFKSIKGGNKYSLFESTEDKDYSETIEKMKKMSAFSRENWKVGRGTYNWDPADPKNIMGDGIAVDEFGPVIYDSDGNVDRITNKRHIQEIIDSIDSVYEYLFGGENENELYNIVRQFFNNNLTTPENIWKELFNYLIKLKRFKAVKIINWKEDFTKGEMDTVIRSAKGLNRFGL